jgi:hypothetical protein
MIGMTLLLTALALLTDPEAAYPIEPLTLRRLYRSADLVVLAKAGPITPIPERSDSWADSKVVLTIERVIKGKPKGKEVTVYTPQGIECPAPDRYPLGKSQLVFLKWSKKLRGYVAPGLSYATRPIEEPVLGLYLRRMEELSRIPAEKPGEPPSAETLDWLVRCMEHPATRWEGAMEFQPPERDDGPRPNAPSPAKLSREQRTRLIDALAATPGFDIDEIFVLQIFKDFPDTRIDTYLATELRAQYARGTFNWTAHLMTLLSERLKFADSAKLIEEFKQAEDDEGTRKVLGKFLDLVEQQ